MNAFDFQKAKAVQLLKNGNAYVIPKRNGRFEITELYLVPNPNEVSCKEYDDEVFYYYKSKQYSSDEILHYKWFTLDGRIGLNPIEYHKETIGLGLAALFFGADVLGNGAIQPGVLETDTMLKAEDAKTMSEQYSKNYGTNATGKNIPILYGGLKYKNIILEPDKAQFLGTKQSIIEDVCRIFNMPPSIIHHHLNSNYSSAEQQDLTFLKYSMNPFITRMEMEDKCKLLSEAEIQSGNVYFKHNIDSLLRPDFEKRVEGMSKMVNSGIIDRNEARAKEEMDWKDGLDEDLVNANAIPNSELVNYYQAKIKSLESRATNQNPNE